MWNRILIVAEWFGEMAERYKLIKDFNRAAKFSFISGSAPTLLEAKVTKGDSNFRHSFSKWMGGGFRIKALAGRPMSNMELREIGGVVLDNDELVRKLISLGWDTLEIHSNEGNLGLKWSLKEYAKLGGFLN